jgi:CheY-like chemotaxis protein
LEGERDSGSSSLQPNEGAAADEEDIVLLVEDNPDDARLFRRAYNKAGIKTPLRVVEDGERALAYLKRTPPFDGERPDPVLILLDLKMPRTSGFEVLEWAKKDPTWRRLPIVVLTSSRETVDITRAYDLGANSFLAKPVRPEALLAMVENINNYWLSLNERPPLVQQSA